MRRLISVLLLVVVTLTVTPLASNAGIIWGRRHKQPKPCQCQQDRFHHEWARSIDRQIGEFFQDTAIMYDGIDNPQQPRTHVQENLGNYGTARAWKEALHFDLSPHQGAIVDTIYIRYDEQLRYIWMRKPNRPVQLGWNVTNMQDNAYRTMHVHVVMHVEGEPMHPWDADIDIDNQNIRELRENGQLLPGYNGYRR